MSFLEAPSTLLAALSSNTFKHFLISPLNLFLILKSWYGFILLHRTLTDYRGTLLFSLQNTASVSNSRMTFLISQTNLGTSSM